MWINLPLEEMEIHGLVSKDLTIVCNEAGFVQRDKNGTRGYYLVWDCPRDMAKFIKRLERFYGTSTSKT